MAHFVRSIHSTQTKTNKVFVNVPVEVATKDLLNGTHTFKTYTYDSYKNPTKEYTNISGKGTHTVTMEYNNINTETVYYIGRPAKKVENRTAYGHTYTTEERYEDYENDLPKKIRSKGHGTDFMVEDRRYDGFGNITEKTITPPDGTAPRTTKYAYDSSGRFLTKATDVEGLSTSYSYNPNNGNLNKETNPYSQSTTYTYDVWGKVTKVTDYLDKSVTTIYAKSGDQSTITETGDDESSKVSVYDILGQLIQVKEKNVMGQWVEKAIKYDHLGRQIEESEPFIGGASQWNTTEYDLYGRISKTTSYTGKATTISYNGLTTIVNDGTKTVTTTKDALGNVTKVTDPGGTINYTYYANGTMKTADYSGSVQRIEQDGWGRKTKLIDPSAGTYTYEYNGFGETVKETTPKGTTTYTYDTYGKLESKKLVGDHTDMQWTYSYNLTTKLPTKIVLTNADGNNTTVSYAYDSHKRIGQTTESNPYAVFTHNYNYDDFGRVSMERYMPRNISPGKSNEKWIKNTYQNGALKSIVDAATEEVLWEVSAVNARGQITEASLGAAIKQTNTYDQYGFPVEFRTRKIVEGGSYTRVLLKYDFNAQRGTLNSRTQQYLFGATAAEENFAYDNLDRLISWSDSGGTHSQTYDGRGRITKNSALGNYVYGGVSYRNTKITVDETALIPGSTEAARQYYQNRPQQNIIYNAFKSPVDIHEQGKERISFQYNAAMGRAHMYYGGQQSDKMQRRYRKHYSADGSMEIKEDTQTGKTTFVAYIGGDAYSAPLIWHSEQGTTTTNNYYYLHRDYLGSILGITDKNGDLKEKRYFDAWGNIVKLTDGAGTALNNFVILDRGYTGHEHLLSLSGVQGSLIHMNGRLYDPVMHRFLMPDNYVQDPFNTQFFNRYGYVLNNPLMYTDPSGEIIPLLIIGAVVGAYIGGAQANGTWNPFKWNWKSSDTWTGIGGGAVLGAVSAGVGTAVAGSIAAVGVSSLMSTAIGGAAGGLIQGGGFSLLPGGDGNFFKGAALGAASGFVGGAAGHIASKGISNIAINGISISSPVLKGALGGIAGGAVGGYAGGFTSGLLTTGDLRLAHKAGFQGMGMGAAIGGIMGAATQYAVAKQQGVNPWSGKQEGKSIVLGRNMNERINPAAKDLGAETISEDWAKKFGSLKILDQHGLEFNRDWLQYRLDNNYNIYDFGRGNMPVGKYYGMELNMIQNYNNVVKGGYLFNSKNFRIIYYGN